MKNILCPIDFTEASETAAIFAKELSQTGKCKITFIHLYHVIPVDSGGESLLASDIILEAEKNAKQQLDLLICRLQEDGSYFEYEEVLKYGIPEEEIPDYVNSHKIDLVVMGTKGASGVKKLLFGSVSAHVADKAACPVLVIPAGFEYKPFNEIVYATDLEGLEDRAVDYVLQLASLFQAHVSFFNVSKHEQKKNPSEIIKYAFEHLLVNNSYENLSFFVSEADDIEEGIRDFVVERKADLLVMATHERNIIQKIFSRSHTREMIYHPDVPVLSVHKSEEKEIAY